MVRLRVLPSEEQKASQTQKQDCGTCRTRTTCWAPGIKEEHIISNLLVCRMKRGIEFNRSAKLFLTMMRPVLKNFAKRAILGTNIDVETALADLESQTIEYIQHYYVMGEIAYPLHYLFGMPNGVIRHFANNYGKKTKKYQELHVLQDATENEENIGAWDEEHDQSVGPQETDMTRAARQVVDDGITLSLLEYRILKFCLSNAVEAKRPLNGLHVYLSKTVGIPRAKITKLFSDASKKMVDEVK